jgi:hypothetical protein
VLVTSVTDFRIVKHERTIAGRITYVPEIPDSENERDYGLL